MLCRDPHLQRPKRHVRQSRLPGDILARFGRVVCAVDQRECFLNLSTHIDMTLHLINIGMAIRYTEVPDRKRFDLELSLPIQPSVTHWKILLKLQTRAAIQQSASFVNNIQAGTNKSVTPSLLMCQSTCGCAAMFHSANCANKSSSHRRKMPSKALERQDPSVLELDSLCIYGGTCGKGTMCSIQERQIQNRAPRMWSAFELQPE